jgi:hypothetical protein
MAEEALSVGDEVGARSLREAFPRLTLAGGWEGVEGVRGDEEVAKLGGVAVEEHGVSLRGMGIC